MDSVSRFITLAIFLPFAVLADGQAARAQGVTGPGSQAGADGAAQVEGSRLPREAASEERPEQAKDAQAPYDASPGNASAAESTANPYAEQTNETKRAGAEARTDKGTSPDEASVPAAATLPGARALSTVYVSVESSLPWLKGSDLRRAIRKQTGFEVVSLTEASARQDRAEASDALLLVITISRRGEVSLVCPKAAGSIQWVRVRPPMRSVLDATATLAAAVLQAAREYQIERAELESRVIERVLLAPGPRSAPDFSSGLYGNPYYGPLPRTPGRAFIAPYNPYHFRRF